jgi:hypothetical protein
MCCVSSSAIGRQSLLKPVADYFPIAHPAQSSQRAPEKRAARNGLIQNIFSPGAFHARKAGLLRRKSSSQ